MMDRLKITDHAIERYQERIAPTLSLASAALELFERIATAKPKHLAKAARKNTQYIPVDGCVLIASHGSIVTVIEKMRGIA